MYYYMFFFFQAEDGIRDDLVTGVQTCALPISLRPFNKQLHSPPWGVSHATDRLRIPVFVIAPVPCERKQVQRTVQRVLDLFQKDPQMERPLVAGLPWPGRPLVSVPVHCAREHYAGLAPAVFALH